MGSSAQDKSTQSAASAGAQQASQQQVANAATSNANASSAYKTLFGTADASGKLSGGNLSAAADPASLNQTGLSGPYSTAYSATANQNANNAGQAVASSQQQQNNRGMGSSPAGFSADQSRQAYQQQAANNATSYNTNAMQQHQDALNQYQYANNLLSQYGSGQTTNATTSLAGGANTNTSLYGTASQQKQGVGSAILGGITGLAGAGASAYGSYTKA